jgi:hypothetical protein
MDANSRQHDGNYPDVCRSAHALSEAELARYQAGLGSICTRSSASSILPNCGAWLVGITKQAELGNKLV